MRILLFIPTLNESGNIELILSVVVNSYPQLDILIIDDNSSDGTIESITKFISTTSKLKLIVRDSKSGIGSAHIHALNYARENNYEFIITMDGDGAHEPESIQDFLVVPEVYDVVIGSRYITSNSLAEWNMYRRILTRSIHLLTKISLNLNYDSSSAFRRYRLATMPESLFTGLKSEGYDFFFESLIELKKYTHITFVEIPIILPARIFGNSKLTLKLALKAGVTLVKLVRDRFLKSLTQSLD